MRRPAIVFVALFVMAFSVFPQQGEIVSRAVGERPLTFGSAVTVVAGAAGTIPMDQAPAPDEIITLYRSLGTRLPRRAATETISYGDFALLVMQAFDLRGGLRYEIFPSRASAFAELQKRVAIDPRIDAGTSINGDVAIDILSVLVGAPR